MDNVENVKNEFSFREVCLDDGRRGFAVESEGIYKFGSSRLGEGITKKLALRDAMKSLTRQNKASEREIKRKLDWIDMANKAIEEIEEPRKFRCQDCDEVLGEDDLIPVDEVKHLHERVAPGEPMPAGECKHCGALAHEVTA